MNFKNRKDAGKKLSESLKEIVTNIENAVILAIPRGGVEVGYEVSSETGIPLDVVIPRKLSAPGNPELAIGAVTGDGSVYIDEKLIRYLGIKESYIIKEVEEKLGEIKKRESIYRGENPPLDIEGKTVIIIDDGIATGATMISALYALRNKNPGRIIVAIPVAPQDAVERVKEVADDVICLHSPEMFFAVGQFYEDFRQTTHEEVLDLLATSGKRGGI